MEVTKCDRCGAYIDKPELKMPVIVYRFSDTDNGFMDNPIERRHVCYECYNEFCNWIKPLKKEEEE